MIVRILQKYGIYFLILKEMPEANRNKRHKKNSVGIPVPTFAEENYTA